MRALVHASLVGSMIVGLLTHHHRRRERPPPRQGTERTTAPLHPQSLARAMGCAATSIAQATELTGDAATRRWQELTDYLEHLSPGRPRKERTASVVTLVPN